MVTFGELSLDPFKLIISIILGALWVYRALADMLTIIVSNSHFGKRPAARDITIVASIFYPMSPTLYSLIDEILRTRPPGHLQG